MIAGKTFIAHTPAAHVVLTAFFRVDYTMRHNISNFQTTVTRRDMFVSTRNSRIGLGLFALYLVFYGGFVLIAAFAPQLMEATPLAGVNVAVWYGFGLIGAALLLALIYGWACRSSGDAAKRGSGSNVSNADGGQS
jgi:uncharacterized membrane protein (DUF485 family)